MRGYIDLFVLPVPKKNLRAYCRTSQRFGRIMKDYGALEYREFLGDDLKPMMMLAAFPSKIKLRRGEVLVSAVIGFRSKSHRDQVNRRAQTDPRAKRLFKEMEKRPLMDNKRTLYGGFSTIVKA